MCMSPSCVFLPMCMSPRVCPLRIYAPSVCMFLFVWLFLGFELLEQQADVAGQWSTQVYACAHVNLIVGVRSVGYTGSRLCPRQLSHWGASSGVYRLMSLSTSVGLLGYICSFDSCAFILSSLRVRLLSCRQLRVRLFFSCLSNDVRRDKRLT